jgi:hypothetical protein
MFAAMLFAISIVALAQFALHYWRAVVAGIAGQPLSERILSAAGVTTEAVTGQDFNVFVGLHDLTPQLNPGGNNIGFVRAYYRVIETVKQFANVRMPSIAAWAETELATCARYAAVQIERRLQANLEQAAAIRSC